ncbi:MAG: hypothetical protein J3Q66DRAFT_199344 [Benniella sp.]|nr:MAG: hypothetical protein J3Q66DRAFT_199344 [Benniella sp.]
MTSQPNAYFLDHNHGSSILVISQRTVSNSAAYLLPHIQPEMSILDVGCGPDTISVDMSNLVLKGRVVGVEYSLELLNGARALLPSKVSQTSSSKWDTSMCLTFQTTLLISCMSIKSCSMWRIPSKRFAR